MVRLPTKVREESSSTGLLSAVAQLKLFHKLFAREGEYLVCKIHDRDYDAAEKHAQGSIKRHATRDPKLSSSPPKKFPKFPDFQGSYGESCTCSRSCRSLFWRPYHRMAAAQMPT